MGQPSGCIIAATDNVVATATPANNDHTAYLDRIGLILLVGGIRLAKAHQYSTYGYSQGKNPFHKIFFCLKLFQVDCHSTDQHPVIIIGRVDVCCAFNKPGCLSEKPTKLFVFRVAGILYRRFSLGVCYNCRVKKILMRLCTVNSGVVKDKLTGTGVALVGTDSLDCASAGASSSLTRTC
jgi:hypothetical protein